MPSTFPPIWNTSCILPRLSPHNTHSILHSTPIELFLDASFPWSITKNRDKISDTKVSPRMWGSKFTCILDNNRVTKVLYLKSCCSRRSFGNVAPNTMVQIRSFYAMVFAEFGVGSDLNIMYIKYEDTLL